MSGTVRFDFMHFMPYVHLPENHKDYKSTWVDFPNKYYDPKRGHALYERYLAEFLLADKLGFDAVVVNEHHNTVYSMMAAPNAVGGVMAAFHSQGGHPDFQGRGPSRSRREARSSRRGAALPVLTSISDTRSIF